MESAIVSLANKYLSTYIKGLDPTDLSLSILKGKIALRNVVSLWERTDYPLECQYSLS